MNNYIQFIHDQSGVIVSDNFTNQSINDRLLSFEIITKDFFPYPGWYTYYRYDDASMGTLLDKGKCFLNDPKESVIYNKTTEVKKIYKR